MKYNKTAFAGVVGVSLLIMGLSTSVADHHEGHDGLEAKVEANQRRYERLIKSLERTVKESRQRVESLQKQKSEWKSELTALETELADLQKLSATREEDILEREEMIAGLDSKFQQLGNVLDTQETTADYQLQLHEKDIQISALLQRFEVVEEQNLQLQKEKKQLAAGYKKETDVYNKTVHTYKEQLGVTEKSVSRMERVLEDSLSQNKALKSDLQEEMSARRYLEDVVADRDRQLDVQQVALEKTKTEKDAAKADALATLELLESFLSDRDNLLGAVKHIRNTLSSGTSG